MMLEKAEKIKRYTANFQGDEVVTISDLEEREFNGEELNDDEREALTIFFKLRIKKLEKKVSQEEAFHARFEYIRALSNIVDYKHFLTEYKHLL